MLCKIAVYFLKKRERKEVLMLTMAVLGMGSFLIFGNLLNQVVPEFSLGSLFGLKKIFIFGISFGVALAFSVSGLLKMSRFLDKIQTNYIIR